MLLPCTTSYLGMPLTPNRASVDRRDSSKGYTPDNIQFVAIIANFAKNAFPEEQLIEFCYAVTGFWGQEHNRSCLLADAGECNINSLPQLVAEPARQVNRRFGILSLSPASEIGETARERQRPAVHYHPAIFEGTVGKTGREMPLHRLGIGQS